MLLLVAESTVIGQSVDYVIMLLGVRVALQILALILRPTLNSRYLVAVIELCGHY